MIIDFDSPTEILPPKVNSNMIDSLTESIKAVSTGVGSKSTRSTNLRKCYLDSHKSTTLGLGREVLLKQFSDLEDIYIPSLWKHVTVDCAFSLERASIYKEERDVERTLRLQHEVMKPVSIPK
ncbi:hypothetical protein INT47_008334 [Mucor saturninus]|uniref:Uncharacterized protein n=1 Tax=Mucor saturninus TaxID=64648 RepID=A0A8H7RFP3_9FUNG|nr:hypothetical protein INT47_008334 [Mucor saturninus]